ncbi:DNA sulfur modification protein DndC [Paenibacillus mucilaginosus]|uniref:phosphoadenosine phosphosulfate reductase domain-containing protein n=1 Tax=Paenibacillus mucilaginosus TaxID=61624 RepID=UPI003D1A9456
MDERYVFSDREHRITIEGNVKKLNNASRRIWSYLHDSGYTFHGVVREYSAVFSEGGANYLALHHFIGEQPAAALMGHDSTFYWHEVLKREEPAGLFLSHLEELGYAILLPEQVWLDAWRNDILADFGCVSRDFHLQSPKHKLMMWISDGKDYLLAEFFFGFPIPPYGVGEQLPWPPLKAQTELTKMDLFDFLGLEYDTAKQESKTVYDGEGFEIAESVDPELLNETQAVIDYCMRTYQHVAVAYSGGKDSHTCLLLVLGYLLDHPECQTRVTVISADTLVENPLLVAHVNKVKERVESLGLGVDFQLVIPDNGDTFYVCVFGKGYAPPSTLNRWCVTRLKSKPADAVIEEYAGRLMARSEKAVLILGTRSNESSNRARSVERHYGDEFFGSHRIAGIDTCAPIKRWRAVDVITHLVRTDAPWGDYGNHNLINLYGSAVGIEECPIGAAMTDVEDGVSACTSSSGARMGCYSCTVIREDTSLVNMAKDYPELEKFVAMRRVFKAAQDIRYGTLTGYMRTRGKAAFQSGLGDLTLDSRVLMLDQMLQLGISVPRNEVIEIYRQVQLRECPEGIPVSRRFRDTLFALLPTHPGPFFTTFNPIWDPWGCGVDEVTEEDGRIVEQIMKEKAAAAKQIEHCEPAARLREENSICCL